LKVKMDLYSIKRTLLTPYILAMRWRERNSPLLLRQMLETLNYSPAFYRFLHDQVALTEAPIDEESVVLDVGAYDGAWAEKVAERYGARLYGFEPNPGVLEEARGRLARFEKVTLFAYALGAEDGTATLTLRHMGSTLFAEASANPRRADESTVDVEVRDIKRVIDELDLDEIDFVKINIEGGEYGLLERLVETGYVARCRILQVQFHEWYRAAYSRRGRIRKAIARTHRIDWDYPFVWERWLRR